MTILLAFVAWLLTYLLHSTLLLLGALALTAAGVVRSHAARDTLWKVALVGGLVTATVQLALRVAPVTGHVAIAAREASPYFDVATIGPRPGVVGGTDTVAGAMFALAPASFSVSQGGVSASAAGAAMARGAALRASRPGAVGPRVRRLLSDVHIGWPGMLLQLWLTGAVALALRLAWLRRGLGRRLKDRTPLVEGPLADMLADLARAAGIAPPRLSVSESLHGPIACGREVILPVRVVREMDAPAQRAVLAHELGHIVRRDPSWLVAAVLLETVLFVQPLNRLARRRLQEASEYLCDEWAAERAGGVALARCLAEVAGWMHRRPQLQPVAGMAEQRSQLVERVRCLLEGSGRVSRPGAWAVRAGASALSLALVAWAAPGVAAEDLGGIPSAESEWGESGKTAGASGDGWATVRDGRLVILAPGYSARLAGRGRLGFRQWGRAFEVPDGWRVEVDGDVVRDRGDRCVDEASVRLIGPGGAWELTPVRVSGAPAYAEHGRELDQLVASAMRRARAGARVKVHVDADHDVNVDHDVDLDHDLNVNVDVDHDVNLDLDLDVDATIDSLVGLWERDPEAVQRAARRLARSYERELRPAFESLGVALGRELAAPELQRLSARVARDLGPEFARLGATLGQTILESLSAAVDEAGAGLGDYRVKKGRRN